MNYIWLDAETTGLDPNNNDIIQLACIPIISGIRKDSFNEFCQPLNYDAIDPGATRVHGITEARMRTFQEQSQMLDKLIAYCRVFDIKFTIAGFNVDFDKRFLSAMFIKHGKSKEFFELFTLGVHDTYSRAKLVKADIPTPNQKLATLASYYNIPINAHDALSDISATIEVDQKIGQLLGEVIQDSEAVSDPVHIEISRKFFEPAQLHVHSVYGMVDSIPTPDEWDKWCEENDVPAFSVVDHGSAVSLYNATKIDRAIPGVGLYIKYENSDDYYALNAWAVSEKGYFNLMKLSSLAYQDVIEDGRTIPLNTLEQIFDNSEGLLFGSAGIDGPVGKLIAQGNEAGAEDMFCELNNKFTHTMRWEFMPTDIAHEFVPKAGFRRVSAEGGNLQKYYNRFLALQIDKFGGECIPTSNAHFISPDDKDIQDCISKNSRKDGAYYQQSYHALKADDMFRGLKMHLGKWLTEDKFEHWIQNTHEIAEMASKVKPKFEFTMPTIDIPDHIKEKTDNYDMQTYYLTIELCKEHGRWQDNPIYIERFKKEIDVIMKNETINFLPYFLVYEDISTYARSVGILQNIARGSAGGSLLSYYLKIIHVDPIAADLPFERFLSHARIRAGSFPDIDMDIGDSARPAVMKYLKKKYDLGFAQICTFSKMKTKNAIKDVMYALYGKNRNDPEIRAVCDIIPDSPQGLSEHNFLYGYTDKEGTTHAGQLDTNEHLANFFEIHPHVAEMVGKMIGLIRGWSRHASAFVIATGDIASQKCPTLVMKDAKVGDILVTQYDANMCEKVGLVKADILGLKTLSSVSECVHRIRDAGGIDYLKEDDNGVALIYRLPEDEGVYTDFYNKDTDSSFQFNTELVKGYVQQFIPTERKHLSHMTALCRPGTLGAEWEPGVSAAQYYMDVRNGKRPMEFIHEDLRPILSESNGIFCIVEDSKVSTIEGDINIQHIQPGFQVLTEDGTYHTVAHRVYNGERKTIRVRLSQGEELLCTPDHRILTDRGWVEAQFLTSKDLVKSFWTEKKRNVIGNDKDWLVGLLLADGNLCNSSYNVACRSKEEAQIVIDIAQKEFNICGGLVEFRNRCWYAELRQVNRNNGFFSKFYEKNKIKELCKKLEIHKLSCKKKFLPNNYTLSTLAGFFDGDGCDQNGLIRLSNQTLAYELYKAFDSYRVPVSYYEEDGVFVIAVRDLTRLPFKFKTAKIPRNVNVPRGYINHFKGKKRSLGDKLRQHFSKRKSNTPISIRACGEIIGNKLNTIHTKWSNVLSIKDNGIQKVYDIGVATNHSFVVGGNTVHNCYQEEVMKFLVEMGGYTAEESDQIRNAIAKKKKDVMMASFDKIRKGTKARGWTEEQTEKVCGHIMAFSRYSFNKSHSHAYAELGYITMYLKHHHNLEWWASVLNCENNEVKMRKYVAYLGNTVAPPSMMKPSKSFDIHKDKIIAPISVIKGIGVNTVKELVSKGPFLDLEDYVEKVNHSKVNIGHVGAMIKARAADSFMDMSIPYPKARKNFTDMYKKIRKTRSEFKPEIFTDDPIKLFIMERDSNECFNKHLLSDPAVLTIIKEAWPGLRSTGRRGIPFTMAGTPVLNDLKVAAGLVKRDWEEEVGMIMLYEGSRVKSGTSKKTGKDWALTSVSLSDGYANMEAAMWNREKPFRWPVDTVVFVKGKLKIGWKNPVSITITEIEKVEKS